MASRVLLHLLLTGVLFHVTAAGDCFAYTNRYGTYKPRESCSYYQYCCGTCENRYCCPYSSNPLSDSDQIACNIKTLTGTAIGLITAGIAIVFIAIISCCCCCCCCDKPRPVVGTTTTTTVVNTRCNMQPSVVQEGQYPGYQSVPTQPAYAGQPMPDYAGQPMPAYAGQPMPDYAGQPMPAYAGQPMPAYAGQPMPDYAAQPMPAGPYQSQPYVAGPPPPYHTVAGPGQPSHPTYKPAQESFTHPSLTDALNQPAYNPSYVQPPNSGY